MKKALYIYCLLLPVLAAAQDENAAIREGNKLYKKGQFDQALPEYQKAIGENPQSSVARYNLANARFRSSNFTEAEKAFDEVIAKTPEKNFKEKSYYNKGVTFSKQQKLNESIDAWKTALKIDPADEDARFNLQKALKERKKQNESKQKNQKQPQQQKQQQKQQPQNNKLDQKKIEQYLKSLEQKEQDVQRKVQQNRARAVTQPEKDW